jgi:phytoene dehydrogenase-like protein
LRFKLTLWHTIGEVKLLYRPQKTIVIIGAGIAGLAAGCYAQMNGYQTKVLEMHTIPGGLCTAWERRGYVFDGCIHYLLGSGPGQPYSRVWEELGALDGRRFVHHDELMRVQGTDGRTLIAYADPDRLEQHMKELSPGDAGPSHALAQAVRQFAHFDMSRLQEKPRALMGMIDWASFGLANMPYLGSLARFGFLPAAAFAREFKDPFLRRAIPELFGWPDIPMMAGISLLAAMSTRNAGFPAGASLEFARAVERRYLELGGEVLYRAAVEKILVEEDANGRARAVGVRLYDDSIHRADYVISTADGRDTIFEMLEGKYLNGAIKRCFDGRLPIHSQAQVSLGLTRDLSGEPHWVTYLLDQPKTIIGQERWAIGVKNYCFDPSLAPTGRSVMIVMLPTTYGYWQRIYGQRLYDSEQSQVTEIVLEFLETVYPGLGKDIEVTDEATPVSYERYTGNWQGSSSGWLLTPRTMLMLIWGMRKTLPGLQNFYMAGQWVEPGGMVPVVAMSGRNAIQLICHADRRAFETHRP